MDPALATASAAALGAAVVAREGIQVTGRAGMGGYTRITSSVVQWTEVGDILPGQPVYTTPVPFIAKKRGGVPLTLVGGRTYEHFLNVLRNGAPVNITSALFVAQVKSRTGLLLATFTPVVLDGPNGSLKLVLASYETERAARLSPTGVWDVEMHLDGKEVTVVPASRVTLVMGVSQASGAICWDPTIGEGVAYNATVHNS